MLSDDYRKSLANWMWRLVVLSVVALGASLLFWFDQRDATAFRVVSYTVLTVVPLAFVLITLYWVALGYLGDKKGPFAPARAIRRR